MEQKSNATFRAEKEYKNSREKFSYLIREVVSNAIHAVLIRKSKKEQSFVPTIEVDIRFTDTNKDVSIEVTDNGDGFNQKNSKYFTFLDQQNSEKLNLKLHPKGQGRLAIIFFSEKAHFRSIFKDESGSFKTKNFFYPQEGTDLFNIDVSEDATLDDKDTSTKVMLSVSKQQKLNRAKTFFKKYSDADLFKEWFIETFFPFFIENEDLVCKVIFNGVSGKITKAYLEHNIEKESFKVCLGDDEAKEWTFTVWILKQGSSKFQSTVKCFARHLCADLECGKLEYEIDLEISREWLLTSEYFDERVDQAGDKIQISDADVGSIQKELNKSLDAHFETQIKQNKDQTKINFEKTKEDFPSLSPFLDDSSVASTRKIVEPNALVNIAIDNKGKTEKAYWTDPNADENEVGKLLNSSLYIYVDHRGKVLKHFNEMINLFDEEGKDKKELESSIHNLLMKRGQNLRDSTNINHLHNLWILDDKYAIFSRTRGVQSTKNGQELSDLYLWIDNDSQKMRELLILELKSTTKAHNAGASGNSKECMVAQVKRYANQFYLNPQNSLGWSVDPDSILYSAIILARTSDISKELLANNGAGAFEKIPFLKFSYYINDKFATAQNTSVPPKMINIRIEMYSYEDIYELAHDRNDVFLKLLNGEMKVKKEE